MAAMHISYLEREATMNPCECNAGADASWFRHHVSCPLNSVHNYGVPEEHGVPDLVFDQAEDEVPPQVEVPSQSGMGYTGEWPWLERLTFWLYSKAVNRGTPKKGWTEIEVNVQHYVIEYPDDE